MAFRMMKSLPLLQKFTQSTAISAARVDPVVNMVENRLLSVATFAKERGMVRNSVIAGSLWFVGDAIAQGIDQRGSGSDVYVWDWKRTMRMTGMGLFVSGPTLSVWYHYLHQKTSHLAASKTRLVLTKMAADQLIFEGPYLALNFCITSFLEGHSMDQLKEKFQNHFVPTFKVDCAVWPTAQAINFSVVPIKWQTPYCSVVCIFWNAFLSIVNHKDEDPLNNENELETINIDTSYLSNFNNVPMRRVDHAFQNVYRSGGIMWA